MRTSLTLVITVGFWVMDVPAQDKAAKKDSEHFQGTWVVTAAERDEEKLSEEDIKGWIFTFKGNKVVGTKKGKADPEQTFALDPGKKPKEIDVTPKVRGIYELEGDRLTIRIYFDGSARPASISGALKKGEALIVLKREKR